MEGKRERSKGRRVWSALGHGVRKADSVEGGDGTPKRGRD